MGDHARRAHANTALLIVGEQAHNRRLDYGNQSHVGVGRDGDGTHQARRQFRRDKDGGRTVGAANDTDSAGFHRGETEQQCDDVGAENTELGCGTNQNQFRVGYQGGEVRHSSDAKEYQRRVKTL